MGVVVLADGLPAFEGGGDGGYEVQGVGPSPRFRVVVVGGVPQLLGFYENVRDQPELAEAIRLYGGGRRIGIKETIAQAPLAFRSVLHLAMFEISGEQVALTGPLPVQGCFVNQ